MQPTSKPKRQAIYAAGLLLTLLAASMLTGCLDFFGTQARKRDEMLKRRDELKHEIARSMHLFNERDRLQVEVNSLDAQLRALHGAQSVMQEIADE